MTAIAIPPPIPGQPIDPPQEDIPEIVQSFEEREGASGTLVGVGYRAYNRFSYAKATLLAAGTTYYLFLAAFSLIAFGYGIAAVLNADQIARYITEAVSEAFPGLLGDEALDPARLKSVGQTSSIVGLLAMLYGGVGSILAASRSMHLIYGAPPDPRSYFAQRGRLLAWLLAVGPLIALSFAASTVLASFTDRALDALGIAWQGGPAMLRASSLLLTLILDFVISYLLLGILGGIRPPRRARLIGALVGAFVFGVLKYSMGLVLGFAVDRPEYGALAAPIGILLVLYLQSLSLYGIAALTAGIAERDVPLELLDATIDTEDAQVDTPE